MTREEEVNFVQDALGNEKKELDDVRAQDGMTGGGNEGLATFAIGDGETKIYEIPPEADAVYLSYVMVYGISGNGGTAAPVLNDAITDGDGASGTITSSTERSPPIPVAAGGLRTVGYEGKKFTGDVITANGLVGALGDEFTLGLSVFVDTNEAE